LSVLLHRGRSNGRLAAIRLTPRRDSLEMRFPARWLKNRPLTAADLHQEVEYLKGVGFRLRVVTAK
jgi:hypothetical protein